MLVKGASAVTTFNSTTSMTLECNFIELCIYNSEHKFLWKKMPPITSFIFTYMCLHYVGMNRFWWPCLVSISTTRFASDLRYRMAKNLIGLYMGNAFFFINNDIKFLNIKWGTRYSLTHLKTSYFLVHTVCGFLHICMLLWSQTLAVNWQK